MKKLFMPSMMCVDPVRLGEVMPLMEHEYIGGLHIDVMDGQFVPNFQLGVDYVKCLRKVTNKPMDLHMMVMNPEEKIGWFPITEGDYVSVHAESTRHLQIAIDRITALGGKPMVAINPGTPLCALDAVLPQLAGVLVMTVNPGYAGQKLVPHTLGKIAELRKLADERGLTDLVIEVDGNVSPVNMVKMNEAGADLFVIGTSGFLKTSEPADIEKGIVDLYEYLK